MGNIQSHLQELGFPGLFDCCERPAVDVASDVRLLDDQDTRQTANTNPFTGDKNRVEYSQYASAYNGAPSTDTNATEATAAKPNEAAKQ
ncbi:unnamed protein product [Vitrella brassicaformis CCMP3155]|uniref:Uncharacterized protein n=1 Tax=Vitrella brassicaformis (strain CCMP3155) TaxID=1169540 RepID=A0A0G4EDC5_VITBC|nr:unnamed protein product [Vitrella brassicaformis CCMP3155]|eukprot:CEL93349.1 unnamed protein product [Vitrella brassicaformis CCMP3155]